jgi:hypothetical protein
MEWAREKKIGGLRRKNRKDGREKWAGCWANFGEENKNGPGSIWGIIFLFNFPKPFINCKLIWFQFKFKF